MSDSIFRISFCVENCPSNYLTKCEVCKIDFPKGEIRIVHPRNMRRSFYWHLNCYLPNVPQFIRESDISNSLKEESKPIFNEWLKTLNSKYFPLDDTPISSVVPSKALPSITLTRRRSLIEIFKFLPISGLISEVNLVCKEFYQISWDSELWQYLIFRDFQKNEELFDSKSKYIKLFNSLCIECKTTPSAETFYRCPYLKKNICKICLKKSKFTVMNRTDILRNYEIDAKFLNLVYGTSGDGKKVAYRYKIEEEIYKFREKNKNSVLGICQILGDDHYFVDKVKSINIKTMDNIFEGDFGSYPFRCHRSSFQDIVDWKFLEKIQKYIKTGKGKVTEAQVIKRVKKKFDAQKSQPLDS